MPDSPLARAGLSPETLQEIDHLMVGCGGFVRELIRYTAGETSIKDTLSGQRVSAADALVDRLLREQLLCLVPGSSGYSEEGGAFGEPQSGLRVRWSVDPLDGTRPAVLGGAFAVSLGALVVDEEGPLAAAGWVYVPTLSVLFRGLLAPGLTECLLNDRLVAAETGLRAADLSNRYLAVGSNWRTERLPGSPLKLSAPGATAVHLVQLVQPGSDVAAVALSRYRSFDAAAGLVIAAAGGCSLYPFSASRDIVPEAADPLRFLYGLDARPSDYGSPALVCRAEVAGMLVGEVEA